MDGGVVTYRRKLCTDYYVLLYNTSGRLVVAT